MSLRLVHSLYVFCRRHYGPTGLFWAVFVFRSMALAKLVRDLVRWRLLSRSGRLSRHGVNLKNQVRLWKQVLRLPVADAKL